MASEILICNQALFFAKSSKRITSLTQGTKEANLCEELYFDYRDQLLEMHYWNFAVGRQQLAVDTDDVPAFGFDFAYQLPADFLKIRSVFDHDRAAGSGTSTGMQVGSVPYKHEGDNVMCDSSEVFLLYTKRISDPNLMSGLFRRALSRMLSAPLAMAISNNARRSEALEKHFEDVDLPQAKSSDSIQDYPDQLPESSWVTERFGGFHGVEPSET